jgi:hypothetical protein
LAERLGENAAVKVDVCSCIFEERYISDVGFGDGERSLFIAILSNGLVTLNVLLFKLEKGREVGKWQGRRIHGC